MSAFDPLRTLAVLSRHLRLGLLVRQTFARFAQDEHRVGERKGSGEAKDQAQPEVSRDDSANEQRESKDKGTTILEDGRGLPAMPALSADQPRLQPGSLCSEITIVELDRIQA